MTGTGFVDLIQEYSGGKYNRVQAVEVSNWVRRVIRDYGEEGLTAVYEHARDNHDIKFKTPPGIKDLDKYLDEVLEVRKDLLPNSYNRKKAAGLLPEPSVHTNLVSATVDVWYEWMRKGKKWDPAAAEAEAKERMRKL